VILGQDPYHNDHQAHGLCFSVRPPTKPPPSLKNVYIALARDYPSFCPPPPPNTGLLTPWADAGVLLLNTCLTVQAHQAASHAGKGWEKFTEAVIDIVAKQSRGVVFLAWGSPALKRTAKVDKKKHLVLSSVHPSPLSASRGFFDCGHFKKCNEWLEGRYGVGGGVDWTLDPKVKAKPAVAANGKAKDTAKEIVAQVNDTVAEATHDIARALAKKQDEFDADEDEDAIEALAAIVDVDEKVKTTKANGHGESDKAKAEDVGATVEEEAEKEAVKE
jgi:uracil-DNA glycosylase